MLGIVAPVEAIAAAHLGDLLLLAHRGGGIGAQIGHILALGGGFHDGADVVDRQEVQMGEARLRQRPEMLHPGGVGGGEGGEGAALRGGDGAIGDAEIADVQLVDAGVLRRV